MPDSLCIATYEFDWEYSQHEHGDIEIVRVDLSRGLILSSQSSSHIMRLTKLSPAPR